MSYSATATATYSDVDVLNVVKRVKADLIMIAENTGAWTLEKATNYAHDIEVLAKAGYLAWVDVTLFNYGAEIQAVRYHTKTNAGSLSTSRPGGVMWPKVPGARLRLVMGHTAEYTPAAEAAMQSRLKIDWGDSTEDMSHSGLSSTGGRDYVSNAFGMQRKDWGR